MVGDAVIDPKRVVRSALIDGDYRWRLERAWNLPHDRGCVTFVMLNPSRADDKVDDNTVRRCMSLADKRGYYALIIVNLFPYITRSPAKLKRWVEGASIAEWRSIRDNEEYVRDACFDRDVVLAYGAHAGDSPTFGAVVLRIHAIVHNGAKSVYRLGDLTKDGYPRHPLYLPNDVEWVAA